MGAGRRGADVTREKKHMTRLGLEPRTYRKLREYSDHLAIACEILQYAQGRVVVLPPGSVVFLAFFIRCGYKR